MPCFPADTVKTTQKKKTKKSENPFSFKKFLATGTGRQSSDGQSKVKDSAPECLESATADVPVFTSELPDFVQNHYSEAPVDSVHKIPESDFHLSQSPLDLPDFTIRGANVDSSRTVDRRLSQSSSLSSTEDRGSYTNILFEDEPVISDVQPTLNDHSEDTLSLSNVDDKQSLVKVCLTLSKLRKLLKLFFVAANISRG